MSSETQYPWWSSRYTFPRLMVGIGAVIQTLAVIIMMFCGIDPAPLLPTMGGAWGWFMKPENKEVE